MIIEKNVALLNVLNLRRREISDKEINWKVWEVWNMANITRRNNKDGSTSYQIRVYIDETGTGKQLMQRMTWRAPASMRPTTADKEAARQAAVFEDKAKQGLASFGGSTRIADYARNWIEVQPLAPKTRELYTTLMERIDIAIGHIRLDKLQAHHLEAFYKNLAEPGMKQRGSYAISDKLGTMLREWKMTKAALSRLSYQYPIKR
jgi:integrase